MFIKSAKVWRLPFADCFTAQYRDVHAVAGIDLTVEQGEFVAFLGPNGAGKTTTLKLLSGVITPSGGAARVMGFVPWLRENAYRRRFALVMGQKNQLWWDLPAQESFRLHQEIYRIEPTQFEATKDELVDLLNVRQLLGQPVRELSLGERMKMELIAALLHSPEVLFLDEPTIGLDVVAQHNIQTFLRHYQQVRKITILLTSHYMKDVAALCRRVVVIASGQNHVRRLAGRHYRSIQQAQNRDVAIGRRLRGGRLEPLRRTVWKCRRRKFGCEFCAKWCRKCWRPFWRITRLKMSASKTCRWSRSSPNYFPRPAAKQFPNRPAKLVDSSSYSRER